MLDAWLHSPIRDLRLALRVLRKTPGTTLLAVVVLGLGIGANAAMFGLVDAVLFRPLAVERAEELAGAFVRNRETGHYTAFSWPDFVDLRERTTTFDELTAHQLVMVGLEEGGTTRRIFVDVVSSDYLRTFGVAPVLGRDFLPEEETPGREAPVAILGHALWQRRGADPEVVGTTVELNGIPFTVIGVAPPRFGGTSALLAPDLLVPMSMKDRLANVFEEGAGRDPWDRDNRSLIVLGRLAAGSDLEHARVELGQLSVQLEAAFPDSNEHLVFEAHPLSRFSISTSPQHDSLGGIALLLIGMALIVLAVAALNLASLQAARAVARRSEVAVRMALGSGRWRVVRQLLLEGWLLALGGGVLGLVAAWGVPHLVEASVRRLAPFEVMLAGGLDLRVIAATFALCLLATLFFGLAPALRATLPELAQELREGGGGAGGTETGGRRSLLSRAHLPVLAEISLTLVLLVVGGLFLKAALRAGGLDPGFDLEGGVHLEVDTAFMGLDEVEGTALATRLRDRLAAMPGVRSVATAVSIPYGMVSYGHSVQPEEAPLPEEGGETIGATSYTVSGDWFETVGVALVQGRSFRVTETEAVVIVDRELAARLWGEGEALGRRVRLSGPGEPTTAEVVGVVETIRDRLFARGEEPHLYRYFGQSYHPNHHLHLRFRDDATARAALPSIRRAVLAVDEDLPVLELRTLRDHMDAGMEVWLMRIGARIFGLFGLIALLLAVAGVYGVRAYSVVRRTREIGIRTALGSSARETLWLVMREGVLLLAWGGAAGVVAALAVGRLLSSLLVDIRPWDPWVLAVATGLLSLVVLIACWLPARRAARLDPSLALRHD